VPIIKAQAVMANSIAVSHYVSQLRVGKLEWRFEGVSREIFSAGVIPNVGVLQKRSDLAGIRLGASTRKIPLARPE
jgi:hypothetical protein